jgi:hypothetical protein
VRAKRSAEHLAENRRALPERLRRGRDQAAPVERLWIEQEAGGQGPIGKPAFEDKMGQRAVVRRREGRYEQAFRDCSDGFRPGRSPIRPGTPSASGACKRAAAGSWMQRSVETSTG